MTKYFSVFRAKVNKEEREFRIFCANEDIVLYDCVVKLENGFPPMVLKNLCMSRKGFAARTGWSG